MANSITLSRVKGDETSKTKLLHANRILYKRMPTTTNSPVVPELKFKVYYEDRDFRAQGKPEPNSRSQLVI